MPQNQNQCEIHAEMEDLRISFSKLIRYNYKTAEWNIIGRSGHFPSREVLGLRCVAQEVAWFSGEGLHLKPWRDLYLMYKALTLSP